MIRPLREQEVDAADHVMRLAFGTYFGAPDPITAMGDAEHVRPRFAAQPQWAFAAATRVHATCVVSWPA